MTSAESDAMSVTERGSEKTPGGPPDWSNCELELECPRCGYNLRGLTGVRCPECGLILDWPAIVKAATNLEHVLLFEYQWRTSPVRSLLRSLVMSVTPWRTWKLIPLTAKPRLAALILQPVFVLLASYPVYVGSVIASKFTEFLKYGLLLPWQALRYSVPWNPIDISELARQYLIGTTLFLWMSVLHQTLTRYRIQKGQLVRIAMLATLTLSVHRIVAVILEAVVLYFASSPTQFELMCVLATSELLFIVLMAWGISRACADYLRIPNAWPVAIAVTASTCLFWITLTIALSVLWDTWNNWLVDLWESSWPGISSIVDWAFNL